MKNQLNLSIKTPCSENFDKFSTTSKGGFCGSCKKEVVDFTTMNAPEIISFLKNKTSDLTCGRISTNQLKTINGSSKPNRRFSLLSGLGLACLSIFSVFSAEAQDLKSTIKTTDKPEVKASKFEKNITVKGIVLEGNLPLPGANIILEGTEKGTSTDFNGNFEFPEKLKPGDVLIVSYVGMTAQKIVIENKKKSLLTIELKINMNMDSSIILGEIAVKQLFKSKRN